MKKLFCILVCVCVLFALCVMTASAETITGSCGENVSYVYDSESKTLTISGTGDMYDSCVPGETYSCYYDMNEYPEWHTWEEKLPKWILIETYYEGGIIYLTVSDIDTVIIEEGVTSLGGSWFTLNSIKYMFLPDSLNSISPNCLSDLATVEGGLGEEGEIEEFSASFEESTNESCSINLGKSENIFFICNDYSYAAEFAIENGINAHYYQHTLVEEGTATCQTKGTIEDYCLDCEYERREYYVYRDHNYTESIIKVATCTEDGEKLRTCIYCNDSETITTSALGHNYVNHEGKAATCTDIGWNAYQTCSNCDYTTYVEIPTLGHSFEETVVTAPTTSSVGQLKRTCTSCGHTEYEEIPMLDVVEGDLDGDGVIAVSDAIVALDAVLGGNATEEADINGDGKVNLIDILSIIAKLVK